MLFPEDPEVSERYIYEVGSDQLTSEGRREKHGAPKQIRERVDSPNDDHELAHEADPEERIDERYLGETIVGHVPKSEVGEDGRGSELMFWGSGRKVDGQLSVFETKATRADEILTFPGLIALASITTTAPMHWQKKMAAQTVDEEVKSATRLETGEGEGRVLTMESTQRLKQKHSESHSLDVVEDSEVKPEAGAEVRADLSSPGDVVTFTMRNRRDQ